MRGQTMRRHWSRLLLIPVSVLVASACGGGSGVGDPSESWTVDIHMRNQYFGDGIFGGVPGQLGYVPRAIHILYEDQVMSASSLVEPGATKSGTAINVRVNSLHIIGTRFADGREGVSVICKATNPEPGQLGHLAQFEVVVDTRNPFHVTCGNGWVNVNGGEEMFTEARLQANLGFGACVNLLAPHESLPAGQLCNFVAPAQVRGVSRSVVMAIKRGSSYEFRAVTSSGQVYKTSCVVPTTGKVIDISLVWQDYVTPPTPPNPPTLPFFHPCGVGS